MIIKKELLNYIIKLNLIIYFSVSLNAERNIFPLLPYNFSSLPTIKFFPSLQNFPPQTNIPQNKIINTHRNNQLTFFQNHNCKPSLQKTPIKSAIFSNGNNIYPVLNLKTIESDESELNKSQNKNNKLNEENIKNHYTQYESIKLELKKSQDNNDELQNTITNLQEDKRKKDQLLKNLESIKLELKKSQDNNDELKNTITNLQEDTRKKDQLLQNLESIELELKKSQDNNDELQNTITNLQEDKCKEDQLLKNLESIENQINELPWWKKLIPYSQTRAEHAKMLEDKKDQENNVVEEFSKKFPQFTLFLNTSPITTKLKNIWKSLPWYQKIGIPGAAGAVTIGLMYLKFSFKLSPIGITKLIGSSFLEIAKDTPWLSKCMPWLSAALGAGWLGQKTVNSFCCQTTPCLDCNALINRNAKHCNKCNLDK